MQLCLFEDAHLSQFHPLTLTRPIDDLRVGILTLREKWEHSLQSKLTARYLRNELNGVFNSPDPDPGEDCLWINSRYFPDTGLLKNISELDTGCALKNNKTVIAARISGDRTLEWLHDDQNRPDFNSLMVVETGKHKALEHIWDIFLLNGDEIRNDIKLLNPDELNEKEYPGTTIFGSNPVYTGSNVTIEPGTVFHTDGGSVYLGDNVVIQSGSMIRGPVAICEGATIKMGAKIYKNTTVGPVCKVGGEVNNCVFHSYSNKAHDGFTGNSIFGQWVNLGADTNTSNLKNNYSPVRITDWEKRVEIETGQQFIGTIMGDHCKTAINTQLNTGTICGVSCNLFSGEFPPKFLPSFSWVGTHVIQPYEFDKALDTMQAMMKRRDVEMDESYEALMRHIYKHRREH